MPKAKKDDVRKRRVIIATLLKEDGDIKTNAILEKLREYNISTTRQTVISDRNYLSKQNLSEYISSDTGIPLEIDRDAVDVEIELNKKLRDETDDLSVKAKFSSIIGRLGVNRANFTDKIYAERVKKQEIEKPEYIVTIGRQKEVNIEEYKKKRDKK